MTDRKADDRPSSTELSGSSEPVVVVSATHPGTPYPGSDSFTTIEVSAPAFISGGKLTPGEDGNLHPPTQPRSVVDELAENAKIARYEQKNPGLSVRHFCSISGRVVEYLPVPGGLPQPDPCRGMCNYCQSCSNVATGHYRADGSRVPCPSLRVAMPDPPSDDEVPVVREDKKELAATLKAESWMSDTLSKEMLEVSVEMSKLEAQRRAVVYAFVMPTLLYFCGSIWGGPFYGAVAFMSWTGGVVGLHSCSRFAPRLMHKWFGLRAMVWFRKIFNLVQPVLFLMTAMFVGYSLARWRANRVKRKLEKRTDSVESETWQSIFSAAFKPILATVLAVGAVAKVVELLEQQVIEMEVQDTVTARWTKGKHLSNELATLVGQRAVEPVIATLKEARPTGLTEIDDMAMASANALRNAREKIAATSASAKSSVYGWAAHVRERASSLLRRKKPEEPSFEEQAAQYDSFGEPAGTEDVSSGDLAKSAARQFWDCIKALVSRYSTAGAFLLGVAVGYLIYVVMETKKIEDALKLEEANSFTMADMSKQDRSFIRIGYIDHTSKFHHTVCGVLLADKILTVWHLKRNWPTGAKVIALVQNNHYVLEQVDENEAEDWLLFRKPSNFPKNVFSVDYTETVSKGDWIYHARFKSLTVVSDESIITTLTQVAVIETNRIGCINRTQPGDCGSPYFDRYGKCVGFHAQGSGGYQYATRITANLILALSKPLPKVNSVGARPLAAQQPSQEKGSQLTTSVNGNSTVRFSETPKGRVAVQRVETRVDEELHDDMDDTPNTAVYTVNPLAKVIQVAKNAPRRSEMVIDSMDNLSCMVSGNVLDSMQRYHWTDLVDNGRETCSQYRWLIVTPDNHKKIWAEHQKCDHEEVYLCSNATAAKRMLNRLRARVNKNAVASNDEANKRKRTRKARAPGEYPHDRANTVDHLRHEDTGDILSGMVLGGGAVAISNWSKNQSTCYHDKSCQSIFAGETLDSKNCHVNCGGHWCRHGAKCKPARAIDFEDTKAPIKPPIPHKTDTEDKKEPAKPAVPAGATPSPKA